MAGREPFCAVQKPNLNVVGYQKVNNPRKPNQGQGGLPGLGLGTKKAPTLPGLGAQADINAQRVRSGYQLERMMNEAIEHHRSGRREEAEKLYRMILQQVPDQPDALNLLGVLAVDGGKKELAVDLITRAAMRRPRDPSILNNLGNALFLQRRHDEAQAHLEMAVALKPDFVEALFNLGRTIRMQGDLIESRYYFQRVIELNPRHSGAMASIARTYEDEGDMAQAEADYRRAMVEFPDRSGGYRGLSHVKKWKGDEPEIELMLEKFDSDQVRPIDRVGFAYALGKIYDDMKEFDKAFEYYKFANDNSGIEHDHQKVVEHYTRIMEIYSPEFLRKNYGNGHPTKKPIFIVGMPRSGTTLTEQIFSAHKDCFGAGELEYAARCSRQLASLSTKVADSPDSLVSVAEGVSSDGWRILGHSYLKAIEQKSPTASRIVDKMPHNYEQLGLISMMLPNAKIIHIRRQAPDTCISCYMHDFNEFHSYNRDLHSAGLYYRQYERLSDYWAEALPMPIFQLKYEDLVMDQEATIRKMLDFCELEWDPNVLEFHKLKRNVVTPSNTQVRQPMYKKAKDRWRNYEANLGPLLEALEWPRENYRKGAAE